MAQWKVTGLNESAHLGVEESVFGSSSGGRFCTVINITDPGFRLGF